MSKMYGYEGFIYPVKVGGTIVLSLDGLTHEVAIEEKAWYLISHASTELDDADYPSLIDELTDKLNALTGFVFSIERATPEGYSIEEGFSILCNQIWSLDFNDASFTFPPEVLGFPRDINAQLTSAFTDGSWRVNSTRSHLGAWLPQSLDGNEASDKRSFSLGETYSSTNDDYEESVYLSMRELRKMRRYRMEWIPGLVIKGGRLRGEDADYREMAGMLPISDGLADDGDELAFDTFWEHAYGGTEFIVVYGDGRTEIAPSPEQVEVCRIGEASQRDDPRQIYSLMEMAGEFYEVDMTLFVVSEGYEY